VILFVAITKIWCGGCEPDHIVTYPEKEFCKILGLASAKFTLILFVPITRHSAEGNRDHFVPSWPLAPKSRISQSVAAPTTTQSISPVKPPNLTLINYQLRLSIPAVPLYLIVVISLD
jgi:hypothetical protein